MSLNDRVNRNTPNSSPKMADAAVKVMHAYQELGRDIELLRDFLARPMSMPGVDLRIAACILANNLLGARLAQMQIDALNEGRVR